MKTANYRKKLSYIPTEDWQWEEGINRADISAST